MGRGDSSARLAVTIGVVALILLNLNGREIGGYDSQPTKYAAAEIVTRHTLTLNRVVERMPGLKERPAFARAMDGSYRSAYPVLPSILAAGPAWVLSRLGVLDLDAPLAPTLVAKLSASLLVAAATGLAFLIARRRASALGAALVAVGYGLGTGAWPVAAQTLGGHETVAFAMMAALVILAAPDRPPVGWRAVAAAAALAVAGAARPQVAPALAVLAASLVARSRPRDWLALALPAAAAVLVVGFNLRWFGHPLGAVPTLEALHPAVHGTDGTFGPPWLGVAGLLLSPSRGLLVFSPVVAVCAAGVRPAWREGARGPLGWCLAAAIAQFLFYASYRVWWGGHTYGPRYCLDLLPLLVPLAAAGVAPVSRRRLTRIVALTALCWSVLVAATGAFSYPAEQWNTNPTDVDRDHARLWEWRDPQFLRCWKSGFSPQNFRLFRRETLGRARLDRTAATNGAVQGRSTRDNDPPPGAYR